MEGELQNLERTIYNNLIESNWNEFKKFYYGKKEDSNLSLKDSSDEAANENKFEIAAYEFSAKKEHTRPKRIVKIGVIQHSIVESIDRPINEQRAAIFTKVKKIIDVAGQEGVNILCLQELWNMPFVFCNGEKQPWCEFAESAEEGPTTSFLRELAVQYAMVIVSPILERDENHCDIVWNTAVVISDTGNVIGKHRKNHIPREGHFNESNYCMEGNTGHPVFATRYGKIAINISFGRHHVLNWMMYGLNGAEIVFNPSASITGDNGREYMWNIEARNAAITNCYFTAAINRVGCEEFPNSRQLFYGSSYFTGPDGVRCPGLSRTKDGLLIAAIDLNMNRQIKDRRCYTMTQRLDMYVKSLNKVLDPEYKPQVIHENDKST